MGVRTDKYLGAGNTKLSGRKRDAKHTSKLNPWNFLETLRQLLR